MIFFLPLVWKMTCYGSKIAQYLKIDQCIKSLLTWGVSPPTYSTNNFIFYPNCWSSFVFSVCMLRRRFLHEGTAWRQNKECHLKVKAFIDCCLIWFYWLMGIDESRRVGFLFHRASNKPLVFLLLSSLISPDNRWLISACLTGVE